MSYAQAALDRLAIEARLAGELIPAEVVAPDGRRIPISVDPELVASRVLRDVSHCVGGFYVDRANVVRDGLLIQAEANTAVRAGDVLAFERDGGSPTVTIFTPTDHGAALAKEYAKTMRAIYCSPEPIAHPTAPAPPSRAPVRKVIDALLCEDARKTPAFATARKAAVLAMAEHLEARACPRPMGHVGAVKMVQMCHDYEAIRGGSTKPSAEAERSKRLWDGASSYAGIDAYERARGMK